EPHPEVGQICRGNRRGAVGCWVVDNVSVERAALVYAVAGKIVDVDNDLAAVRFGPGDVALQTCQVGESSGPRSAGWRRSHSNGTRISASFLSAKYWNVFSLLKV